MPRSSRPLLRPLRWVGGAAIVGALATSSPAAAAMTAAHAVRAGVLPADVVPADVLGAAPTAPGGATAPAADPSRPASPQPAELEDPYGAGLGAMDVAVGSGLVLAVALTVRLATRKPVTGTVPSATPRRRLVVEHLTVEHLADEPAAGRELDESAFTGPAGRARP